MCAYWSKEDLMLNGKMYIFTVLFSEYMNKCFFKDCKYTWKLLLAWCYVNTVKVPHFLYCVLSHLYRVVIRKIAFRKTVSPWVYTLQKAQLDVGLKSMSSKFQILFCYAMHYSLICASYVMEPSNLLA